MDIQNEKTFEECLDQMCENIQVVFWTNLSRVHHFGNVEDKNPTNIGFPLLIALISEKKFNYAMILLKKWSKLATIYSTNGWEPLAEAIFQGHLISRRMSIDSGKEKENQKMISQCITLIHLLMRNGANPNRIGTRDPVEKNGSAFGLRFITPKKMVSTFFHSMRKIMDFEISYRQKFGHDLNHICTKLCTSDLRLMQEIVAGNEGSTSDEFCSNETEINQETEEDDCDN